MSQSATSLYHRMGGYDVIAAVIDDLFAILHGDAAFGRFFGGRSTNMDASDAALGKNGGRDAERAEFLALFQRYRDDIVEDD